MMITPECHTRTLRLTQTYKMILTVTYSNIHNETIIHTKKNYIRHKMIVTVSHIRQSHTYIRGHIQLILQKYQ